MLILKTISFFLLCKSRKNYKDRPSKRPICLSKMLYSERFSLFLDVQRRIFDGEHYVSNSPVDQQNLLNFPRIVAANLFNGDIEDKLEEIFGG